MEKEELCAQLDAAGVDYDGRWGPERLQQALHEALGAPQTILEPAPPVMAETIPCRVLRAYWVKPGREGKVAKGSIVELTAEEVMEGLERGTVERIK